MHENKNIYFLKNWVFLIPDLYLYDIKIQTNISQNNVEKIHGKIIIFKYIYNKKHTKQKRRKIN